MTGFWTRVRALWREMRAESHEQKRLNEQIADERHADEQARHDAGIFERPRGTGF